MNDNRLHKEWATRPDDERFLTLEDLASSVAARRDRSGERVLDVVDVAQVGDDVQLMGPKGPAKLTHWSFGQLSRLAGAPADYLRTLPAELAAPSLAWSLRAKRAQRDREQAKVLVTMRADATVECRAITGVDYGRIWDADVVEALQRLGTDWHVPSASYEGRDPKRATTLYASDRDVFVFLCRQEPIEVGGTVLNRGVMAWNSETGKSSFGLATFTYDRVCDNRIIWGVGNRQEIRLRHTSGAPRRLISEVRPLLASYAQEDTAQIVAKVEAARRCVVADNEDDVLEWMRKRGFTLAQSKAAFESASQDARDQKLNPYSVWGLVQGVTDAAHSIGHTDARVDVERAAGALLDTVAV
jgi:hypothetical protein